MTPSAHSDAKPEPFDLRRIARTHPIRFFFSTFFTYLGCIHAVNDLFRYAFSWSLDKPGEEYFMAFAMAVSLTFFLPRLPKPMSEEERRAEKRILDEAAAIDRAARGGTTS
jgi:hypothetical protein